jgi:hypothetical protein
MTTRSKFLLAALTAALALSLAVGTASALRSLSIEGSETVVGEGVVSFIQNTAGGTTVRCPTTITRTISRAIPKTNGILLGRITRIETNRPEANCTSSTGILQGIIILAPEPREEAGSTKCRLFFESIAGTLPNITGINKIIKGCLIGFETRVEIIGVVRCLYKENGAGIPARENVERGGRITSVEIGRNRAVILEGQNGFCPREGELFGTIVPRNSPTVRLI